MAELQVGSPVPLEVIARCAGTRRGEALLHQTFGYCWSHGEWFKLDDNLRQFIDLVKEGEA